MAFARARFLSRLDQQQHFEIDSRCCLAFAPRGASGFVQALMHLDRFWTVRLHAFGAERGSNANEQSS